MRFLIIKFIYKTYIEVEFNQTHHHKYHNYLDYYQYY